MPGVLRRLAFFMGGPDLSTPEQCPVFFKVIATTRGQFAVTFRFQRRDQQPETLYGIHRFQGL